MVKQSKYTTLEFEGKTFAVFIVSEKTIDEKEIEDNIYYHFVIYLNEYENDIYNYSENDYDIKFFEINKELMHNTICNFEKMFLEHDNINKSYMKI